MFLMQSTTDTTQTAQFPVGILIGMYAFMGLWVVVSVIAWISILRKAGYSPAWLLLGLIPCVSPFFFLVFAFSKWPVVQEAERRRYQPPPPMSPAAMAMGYGRPNYGVQPGITANPHTAYPQPGAFPQQPPGPPQQPGAPQPPY